MALVRLQNEYKRFKKNPVAMSRIVPKDNFMEWSAFISGPTDTPYEGGTFELNIKFSKDYPTKYPEVIFTTQIYHMNVNKSGSICISLWSEWLPTFTVSTILLAVIALLGQPNPDNPYPERGDLYKKDPAAYNAKAKEWTKLYAMK